MTQAISTTSAVAVVTNSRIGREARTSSCCRGTTSTSRPTLGPASPATSNRARRTTTRASIVACCDETPSRTRPRANIGVVMLIVMDESAGFVRS